MIRQILSIVCAAVLLFSMVGCSKADAKPRIGVSFGVGAADRWEDEKIYMEEYAQELGAEIEVRLNRNDTPKTQLQDCQEMIDSGIDVLILTHRDVSNASKILKYAKSKGVPVISYSRVLLGQEVALFVGCDSSRIGQTMGQYLSELVYKGDYIILRGDEGDNNATLIYNDAMRSLSPVLQDINILLDTPVRGWDAEQAKKLVLETVAANGNRVDAILAPNDKIAGACAEALAELGVTTPVVITGLDAELDAVRRIVAGTQSMTVYMDFKSQARTAVEQACHMARGEQVEINAELDNQGEGLINANLITGQLVTKENLDKILIESGQYTRDEVYNPQ